MEFKTAITVNGTPLTDGQGSVPFGRLPVAASGESSAVKLVRADDSRLAAGTPAWSAITGKPTTIAGFGITDPLAYKNADNQFTVAQGMRAAASGQAAGLYVPWVSGDASPTLLVGSTTSGMNQIAIYGKSVSSVGVQ